MQLDKLVTYHKALADPTRIRFLVLLANRELSGLELSAKLAVSPATVTHHAAKLREASLIGERRDKNTIYFSLDEYFIRNVGTATAELIFKNKEKGELKPDMEQVDDRFRSSVLRNFFTSEGKLRHIPAQHKKKLIVLEELVNQLEPGRRYSEAEINEFIKPYHPDFATLRREFIMQQFMFRENDIYELNPPELWTKWQSLS